MTPLAEWGNVWGTSVTVPVTISTSYYVPQTKFGNILFLLCFLLLLRSSVSTEDLLVILMFLFLFYYYYYSFSYRFCARDFSETARWIFMKLSGKMCHKMNQIRFFSFFEIHFRSRVTADFPFFGRHFVHASLAKRLEIKS